MTPRFVIRMNIWGRGNLAVGDDDDVCMHCPLGVGSPSFCLILFFFFSRMYQEDQEKGSIVLSSFKEIKLDTPNFGGGRLSCKPIHYVMAQYYCIVL